MTHILIVDDEPDIRTLVKEILEDEGFQVELAANATEARSAVARVVPSLILLDIWMPDTDGVTLLREWTRQQELHCPIVMMSGHGTVEAAVEATRLGAYDFLEKPLSTAKLLLTLRRALEAASLRRENLHLRHHGQADVHPPLGKSRLMHDLREQLLKVAQHATPVLIYGEPGTDKERLARYLHMHSARANGSFIPVTVTKAGGAPAADLTGGSDKPGLLDRSHQGSLFVKDLAYADSGLQALLLQLLERRGYERPEGDFVAVDTRVIAATSEDPEQCAKRGAWSEDLYYRLNVVPVRLPPLREHREDLPELLEHQVNQLVEREGLRYRHFSVAAQNRLRGYHWPGNVRELKNLVQRLLILGNEGDIGPEEIEPMLSQGPHTLHTGHLPIFDLSLREAREIFERAYLEYRLRKMDNNISKVAIAIGMERSHLYRKIKLLGIQLKN